MPNIHQAILIGASAEVVYHAITSQERLSAWWTPNTKATPEVNSIARFTFGNDYYKEMEITDLKPFELVKWDCLTGDSEWVGTKISFTIIPGNKRDLLRSHPQILGQIEQQTNENITLLIFHHNDWREDSLMFAECSYTWGQFLRSLKLLCETGVGKPWPNQHNF